MNEPKRGDMVWVRNTCERWIQRGFLVDLGEGIKKRYLAFVKDSCRAWIGYGEMSTTDPNLKERIPHWVHVRDYATSCGWQKRILDREEGYRCVSDGHEDKYIAGEEYETVGWRYMQEIPKKTWWVAHDYAERQITWLKEKRTGSFWRIKDLGDDADSMMRLDVPQTARTFHSTYEHIAEDYTLPDGTELKK